MKKTIHAFARRAASTRKTAAFYEENALARRYFYHVDLLGRLFLEETEPKSIATSLKSPRFLSFFFSQLSLNDPSGSFGSDYPFISPCGTEMNYIACADTPIVFDDLVGGAASSGGELVYADGAHREPFDASALTLCAASGRLYHPLTTHKRVTGLALVRSHLAISICERVDFDAEAANAGTRATGHIFNSEDGKRYPIRSMDPEQCEDDGVRCTARSVVRRRRARRAAKAQ